MASYYVADLPTVALPSGSEIVFTFYWVDVARWEGTDFTVKIDGSAPAGLAELNPRA